MDLHSISTYEELIISVEFPSMALQRYKPSSLTLVTFRLNCNVCSFNVNKCLSDTLWPLGISQYSMETLNPVCMYTVQFSSNILFTKTFGSDGTISEIKEDYYNSKHSFYLII